MMYISSAANVAAWWWDYTLLRIWFLDLAWHKYTIVHICIICLLYKGRYIAIKIALYCDSHSAVFLYDLGVQNVSYDNNIIFIAQYLPSYWSEILLLKIDTSDNYIGNNERPQLHGPTLTALQLTLHQLATLWYWNSFSNGFGISGSFLQRKHLFIARTYRTRPDTVCTNFGEMAQIISTHLLLSYDAIILIIHKYL